MTRCALLLSLLEEAGPRGITTAEILQAGVGSRYGARLMELRKAGHRITSERVREGSWRYTLEDGRDRQVRGAGCSGGELSREPDICGRSSVAAADYATGPPSRLFDPPSRYDELVRRSA